MTAEAPASHFLNGRGLGILQQERINQICCLIVRNNTDPLPLASQDLCRTFQQRRFSRSKKATHKDQLRAHAFPFEYTFCRDDRLHVIRLPQ